LPSYTNGRHQIMQTLSLVVITKNEAANLRRCLASVPFAHEIIVIDAESTDSTREIAREYTELVFNQAWKGYGPTKQEAINRASCDWVLSLDADEALDDTLAQAIRNILTNDEDSVPGYRVNRLSMFVGRWIRHSGWHPDRILRMGRRAALRCTQEPVHEKLVVDGSVGDLSGCLLHYGASDLNAYLAKSHHYADLLAQNKFENGGRSGVLDLCIRPAYKFCYSYFFRWGFLDGVPGLILAGVSAYYVFVKYARLWEMRRGAASGDGSPHGDQK
jgi:glycosyltransferase involved in cell wall biosynthesis